MDDMMTASRAKTPTWGMQGKMTTNILSSSTVFTRTRKGIRTYRGFGRDITTSAESRRHRDSSCERRYRGSGEDTAAQVKTS